MRLTHHRNRDESARSGTPRSGVIPITVPVPRLRTVEKGAKPTRAFARAHRGGGVGTGIPVPSPFSGRNALSTV